jgi:hypothetical protein
LVGPLTYSVSEIPPSVFCLVLGSFSRLYIIGVLWSDAC